jgi:uncharacterized protein
MKMNLITIILLLVIGLAAGVLGGVVGVGGGIIVVPALVLLLGYSQHSAQGTTLAMLVPPIGLLAAMQYYERGFIDIKAAAILAAAFIIGGYWGGKLAVHLSDNVVKRFFAVFMMIIAVKLLFFDKK